VPSWPQRIVVDPAVMPYLDPTLAQWDGEHMTVTAGNGQAVYRFVGQTFQQLSWDAQGGPPAYFMVLDMVGLNGQVVQAQAQRQAPPSAAELAAARERAETEAQIQQLETLAATLRAKMNGHQVESDEPEMILEPVRPGPQMPIAGARLRTRPLRVDQ
jgi:hypothetical protein